MSARTFLVWQHANGRAYRRQLRSSTFRVPTQCVCFTIVHESSGKDDA